MTFMIRFSKMIVLSFGLLTLLSSCASMRGGCSSEKCSMKKEECSGEQCSLKKEGCACSKEKAATCADCGKDAKDCTCNHGCQCSGHGHAKHKGKEKHKHNGHKHKEHHQAKHHDHKAGETCSGENCPLNPKKK
jgi:hypothetical protein